MSPNIVVRSSCRREGDVRVMRPRAGSRQTRRKCRFQSTAASAATVSASACSTWTVEPRGPVKEVGSGFTIRISLRSGPRRVSQGIRGEYTSPIARARSATGSRFRRLGGSHPPPMTSTVWPGVMARPAHTVPAILFGAAVSRNARPLLRPRDEPIRSSTLGQASSVKRGIDLEPLAVLPHLEPSVHHRLRPPGRFQMWTPRMPHPGSVAR